ETSYFLCRLVSVSTVTSADFSRQLLSVLPKKNVRTSVRPPRVRTITFIPYTCCIYHVVPVQYRTSIHVAISSGQLWPYMNFLFVRPGVCRRLPSDSTSRWTPLPLANTSYC